MKTDLREIEQRLDRALTGATGWLPASELADMHSLVKAGEPGIALENLCTQLFEHNVTVPADVLTELEDLASAMSMRVPLLTRLR